MNWCVHCQQDKALAATSSPLPMITHCSALQPHSLSMIHAVSAALLPAVLVCKRLVVIGIFKSISNPSFTYLMGLMGGGGGGGGGVLQFRD